ncbi:hypothetical protein ASPWEDRAFT_99460 [Aspergillus wentii DTO 134E9]|uniref:SprT-like domain-containing protein n=1 Tax=Aspergillus wentii DTO 134E9 TaxID=1073089 RepID=A0A1L9RZK6_ASPWE|nr:uncharacterized protein ASPWEDRAFT_99460 [Aspergillus wentii DTO 134E9]OJJ40342.1 hypothetical protein ASPWEDRAFT_99460 [Aspergillus wentii DTO 134E9]
MTGSGGKWTMAGETQTKSGTSRLLNRPLFGKSRPQKIGTGFSGGGDFDIFSDSDFMTEREGEEYDSSIGPSRDEKTKKRIPLKLAHVNSLLLPLSSPQTQQRNRRNRKPEIDDYDKENDPIEVAGDDEDGDRGSGLSRNSSNASTRQSPARRNVQQTPGRNMNGRQFLGYRQPKREKDDEDSEDNGFDSLDDFIVSDNEEPSSYETSQDETDDEKVQETPPPPPPKTRKRLVRGRRPDPETELKKALENPLQKEELRLEPSLPAAITMSSSKPQPKPKQRFQNGLNVAEKMNHLNLENNDASSQIEKDLYDVVAELDSPSSESESVQILETPPTSPTKNRLQSPTKQKALIPPTPYRESVDAFWSQEATNDWVDQHSPRKKLEDLLQEFEESDNDDRQQPDIMPRARPVKKEPKTPSKTALKKAEMEQKKAALALKKSFDSRKASFAEDFLKVLDDAVSGGQVQKQAKDTGGVRITWSKTLQTTAGRASWKRERIRTSGNGSDTKVSKEHAIIELAERIIDNEDRLINTVAHEYCHLANYMISNVHNNPHGASFKQWGRKCMEAMKDHPVYGGRIEVTTKHNYQIDYKYLWCCVDCGQNYGRHSKSIDPKTARCGRCKGSLQQIKPKPRNVSPRKNQPAQSASASEKRSIEDVAKVFGEVSLNT